jgi:hypothetical protein
MRWLDVAASAEVRYGATEEPADGAVSSGI